MARQPTFAVHISLTVSLKNVYSDLAERLLERGIMKAVWPSSIAAKQRRKRWSRLSRSRQRPSRCISARARHGCGRKITPTCLKGCAKPGCQRADQYLRFRSPLLALQEGTCDKT